MKNEAIDKKEKMVKIVLLSSILFALFMCGIVLGMFDFLCSTRVGKTNFYLAENISHVVGLDFKYSEDDEYSVRVVPGRLIDAYWNEQYILTTEYAVQNDSITGYYIVKILSLVKKGVPWKVIGPLSKEEFERTKRELCLEEKEMKHVSF